MDAILNPYSPGAGTLPHELAGRDALREQVRVALARVRARRAAKSVIILGLRGVGKTVLLDKMRAEAESDGICTVRAEVPENRSLPAVLVPQLRTALLRLSRTASARDMAERVLRGLVGFAKGLKVKYGDLEINYDREAEPGLADNGDLESDLADLLDAVGQVALQAGTAVALFLDEIQYLAPDQFGALISALHRCAQRQLPVTMVGAGLPQLRGLAGNAKSYAERMFAFPMIGALTATEAELALRRPASEQGVQFTADAIQSIMDRTEGYPYFLQEWGKHAWDVADSSPITRRDVERATLEAVSVLDAEFFGVRFDRLTPSEKRYLRAMAQLGPGPHRSGEVATELGRPSSTHLAKIRQGLIAKGMIWSPSHGDTAFTVPMFDGYMKRIMPGADWRAE